MRAISYVSALLLLATAACSSVSPIEPDLGPVSEREEEDPRSEFYVYQFLSDRTWRSQDASAGSGYVSVETQNRLALILAEARTEGLIQPPECMGLEMPERLPETWIQHVHIGADSISVEVIGECDAEPPVPEVFDGVTDVWWEESVVLEYGAQCRHEWDGEARTMNCNTIEKFDESTTVTYPTLREYDMGTWDFEAETECEGAICYILDLDLWPSDPATGETQVFEASCAEHPEWCSLIIELIDPRDLVIDEDEEDDSDGDEKEEPKEGADDDCKQTIQNYNDGGIGCSAAVAECAADGTCTRDHDDYQDPEGDGGYDDCETDGVNTECVQCTQATKEECEDAWVEVTPTQKDGLDDLLEQDEAGRRFKNAEDNADHEPPEWVAPKGADPAGGCSIVDSGPAGRHNKYRVRCE